MDDSKWKVPATGLTRLDVGFGPVGGIKSYLPSYYEIPEEFRKANMNRTNKWVNFVDDTFFKGISEVRCVVRDKNIDQGDAMKHLKMLIGSFDLSHEHKTAGIAYLASLWFEDITYIVRK